MAETTEQHDRTEQPSSKRLEDARREGRVPRSRELSMTLVVLTGAGMLLAAQGHFAGGLARIFEAGLSLPRAAVLDPQMLAHGLATSVAMALQLLLPLFAAVLAAAVLGGVALGGWSFSFAGLVPNFAKLNPAAGMKRLFGWHGLSELAKALAKFAFVAVAGYLLLSGLTSEFLELGTLTLDAALARAARLCLLCFAGLSGTLVLIAAVDVPLQFWQFRRQLRMTKQELRDEQKETEGRPEVRSRVRSLQRAIATRRMMADVPKADVVAMNPTHYAVALRYDAGTMKAPRVIAKGADLMALNIRRIAEAHNVPIFEDPQFTRALYYTSEVGGEVSPRLYVAVAQVLTYIYQLTGKAAGGRGATVKSRKPPQKPALQIEPELLVPQRGRKGRRLEA